MKKIRTIHLRTNKIVDPSAKRKLGISFDMYNTNKTIDFIGKKQHINTRKTILHQSEIYQGTGY